VASPALAELRALSRDRDRLLESQQRVEAQLRAILDAYHPAPASLFSSVDRDITLAFIANYPTPQAASRIGEQRMAAFCRRQSYRGRVDPAVLTQRLKDHLLTGAEGTVAGKSHSALVFAELLGLLNGQLDDYDDALELALAKHPDAGIFTSFPGVGLITASTLLPRSGRTAATTPRSGCCSPKPAGAGHPLQRPVPPSALPLRRQHPTAGGLHVVGLQLAQDLTVGTRGLRPGPRPQAAPSPSAPRPRCPLDACPLASLERRRPLRPATPPQDLAGRRPGATTTSAAA
jgi:hypothetical protein